MLRCIHTRCVLNWQKIKTYISCDIDTNIDAKQIMEHLCMFIMIKFVDFDPFMHGQTASLPLSYRYAQYLKTTEHSNSRLCGTSILRF